MSTLVLPPKIGTGTFFSFLRETNNHETELPVTIDFTALTNITAGGLTALISIVDRWRLRGREVTCAGLEDCSILGYLQRMDLLRHLEVHLPETFNRQSSRGRFMPLQRITVNVDDLASEIASCLAPGGEDYQNPISELYDLIQYIVTETANNVRQHSGGEGFAVAQTRSGMVRISIADSGMGILGSFRASGLEWANNADHSFAIDQALKPNVSSKGAPVNAGVGLTMVHQLVTLLGGWMAINSGDSVAWIGPQTKGGATTRCPDNAEFRGTLLVLAFKTEDVSDWSALLERAKIRAGLLREDFEGGRFLP